MSNTEKNKWLDRALSDTIGSKSTTPDFEQWKLKHPREIEKLTSGANINSEIESSTCIRKIIMKNPVIKLAAAAAIIIALIGMFQLWNGSSNSAYARTVQQFKNAQTLIFTMYLPNDNKVASDKIQMAFKEPGYMRTEMSGGYVTVSDWKQGKAISLLPTRKQYVEMTMDDLTNDPVQRQFKAIEELRALPENADEFLGVVEKDGRELEGFLVSRNNTVQKVWLDSQTLEPVMIETEFINAPGMNSVMTNFQFNVELNDSFFSVMPPSGYSKMDVRINASQANEDDLLDYLRMWASWTKDNTFPPTFNPLELQKLAMEMEQQGGFNASNNGNTSEQRISEAQLMTKGIMFVMQLPSDSNWKYAGENIKLGDSETPIFWYRPVNSEMYRVIYGDLHVEITVPEDIP